MVQRDEAQKLAINTKTNEDWNKYKKLRNCINNRVKKEKSTWQSQKFTQCEGNSCKLWKNVLGWLNWSSIVTPSQLFYEGKLENKPNKIANIMNKFFIDKVKKIRESITKHQNDPLFTLKKLMRNRNSQFSLQYVYPDTVDKIISSLKNSKSCGM